ncbi:MAG: dihydrofolate reductase family protein [Patescibacteria group bacterium]
MEVSVAVVMSLDGKLTRHDKSGSKELASSEEQQHFYALMAEYGIVVMGSGTYKVIKGSLNHRADLLRIVLTSKAPSYELESMPGKLEFSMETPGQLVDRLESQGHNKLLIVGGPQMISDFLAAKLISKLYVTVEPRLFGQGKPLLSDLPVDVKLELIKHERLNTQGTLLLTYEVISN